jgi:hypothetical protein
VWVEALGRAEDDPGDRGSAPVGTASRDFRECAASEAISIMACRSGRSNTSVATTVVEEREV